MKNAKTSESLRRHHKLHPEHAIKSCKGMNSPESRAKQAASLKELHKNSPEYHKQAISAIHNEKSRAKQAQSMKEHHKEHPEHLKALWNGQGKHPNNEEKRILPILKKLGFDFVGDGKFRVGNKCPDFINKEKRLIIEYNGCYYHGCNKGCRTNREYEDPTERIKLFETLGYRTLVIWTHEMNEVKWQPERVSEIVKSFVNLV